MFARVSCACRHGSWVVLCNLCQDDGLCYGGFEKDLGRVSQVMRNRDFWGVRVHIYPVYREGLVRYIARSINRHISSTSYIKSCMHQLKYLRNLHHHHRIHCQGACALCGLSTACFGGLVRDILCVGLSIKQFKFTAVLDILQPWKPIDLFKIQTSTIHQCWNGLLLLFFLGMGMAGSSNSGRKSNKYSFLIGKTQRSKASTDPLRRTWDVCHSSTTWRIGVRGLAPVPWCWDWDFEIGDWLSRVTHQKPSISTIQTETRAQQFLSWSSLKTSQILPPPSPRTDLWMLRECFWVPGLSSSWEW